VFHDCGRSRTRAGSAQAGGGIIRAVPHCQSWPLPRVRQLEMGEDPLNYGRVLDRGDEMHPPGTARTTQDVQVERSAHERSPRPVARPLAAATPRPGPPHCRAWTCCPITLRTAISHDLRSPPRMRGECAVVKHQVDLGPRRQGRQFLDRWQDAGGDFRPGAAGAHNCSNRARSLGRRSGTRETPAR
jgi:hypothetical protein